MSDLNVLTEIRDGVALITLDRPPVNSLSQPMRQALWDALEAADANAAVRSIVLTGAIRGFCAGGELSELRSGMQQAKPGISNHLLPRIEACTKPVIAAIHGFAIGGGMEMALACHYRVAQRDARIALPEMKHQVIPPSGSQRMPRAIGVEQTLDLIVSGETWPASRFAGTSLFDVLCDADVVGTALEFAAKLPEVKSLQGLLLRNRPWPESRDVALAALAGYREKLAARPEATPAMHHCVTAVEFAVLADDFESGLRSSKQLHDQLAQARAITPW